MGPIRPSPPLRTAHARPGGSFVIGYTGSLDAQTQLDLDTACSELALQCVHAETITDLADQGVDAIINSSNQWDVMGSAPALHAAVERGLPVFVLNAETGEPGAYNLSAEYEIYTSTLHWLLKQMGGQGEFVYYNFGDSTYIQSIVDEVLKDYPGITAIKRTPISTAILSPSRISSTCSPRIQSLARSGPPDS